MNSNTKTIVIAVSVLLASLVLSAISPFLVVGILIGLAVVSIVRSRKEKAGR